MGSRTQSPFTESNRRPSPYHGDALPTELKGQRRRTVHRGSGEREIGLAPPFAGPFGGRFSGPQPPPRTSLLELVGEFQQGALPACSGGELHAQRHALR